MMVSQNIGTPRYPPFLDGIFHSRPFGGYPHDYGLHLARQVKAGTAEEAGAVAVVIYNDHRPPVESMEGGRKMRSNCRQSIVVHSD